MTATALPIRQIVIVNALPSGSRTVAREFGAELNQHDGGTQYYRGALDQRARGRRRGEDFEPTETHMVNTPVAALDVCVRTAKLLGRCGATDTESPVHRTVILLYADPAVESPSLAVSIHGRLQERAYYPDMLISHDLEEIRSEAEEASGFVAAASRLCGPHEIVVLAVPGQHSALRESIQDLRSICLAMLNVRPPEVLLSEEERSAVAELARSTGASRAQRDRLNQVARAASIRGCPVTKLVRSVPMNSDCATAIRHIEELIR